MGKALTIDEVCERLHITRNHWNQLAFRGDIPARIIVSPRKHLVDEDVLNAWLAKRQEPTREAVGA